MLNSKDIIERMVKHFPRWMDIRKRVSKSDGGKLLSSIADEVSEIQAAIEDYKRDYFLDSYEGREDDITAFLYKAHIGSVDINTLRLINPELPITDDIEEFYKANKAACYSDGYIYIKTTDTSKDYIIYSIDGFQTKAYIEKIHVWNIFDEFACFMGIQRHEGEKNSELVVRIYNVFKNRANSTETGIKNAILNELSVIDPSLSIEEIKIEKPTPENLLKYYDEFQTIIDKLADINRDVYRTKKWDIDTWTRPFKAVDYIPHAWDVVLDYYSNGIGFKDDLQVDLIDINDTTNAELSFYSKSESIISSYIKNRNIPQKINLKLSKYNNMLTPIKVKYKITASEVKDITNDNIAVRCSEKINGKEELNIQDIAEDTKNIEIINKGLLENNKLYRLQFTPKSEFGTMSISKCNIVSDTTTSLLAAKPGFAFDANGVLSSSNTKLYLTKKYQYTSADNIINVEDGVAIKNYTGSGELSVKVDGLANSMVKVEHYCQKSDVLESNIVYNNFFRTNDNKIISDTVIGEKYIEINVEANSVSFTVEQGRFAVMTNIDGIDRPMVSMIGPYNYSTEAYDTPKVIKIKIISMNASIADRVLISDLQYNKYDFQMSLTSGDFLRFGAAIALPNVYYNNIKVSMRTYTGFSPVLKYVYVGDGLNGVAYITDIIPYNGKQRTVDIKTNCNVTLLEVNAAGDTINTFVNYKPYKEYKALSKDAFIKLNLSNYNAINSLLTYRGRIETISNGSVNDYYLRLNEGEIVSSIVVDGQRLITTKEMLIKDMFKLSSTDRLHANKLLEGFVIENGSNQRLEKLMYSIIPSAGEKVEIVNLPLELNCSFVINSSTNSMVIGSSYEGIFESVYIYPKNSKEYIAYNESRLIKKELRDIEIVDVFNPFIPSNNEQLVYKVESMTENAKVKFDIPNKDFISSNDWALGHLKLRIQSDIDLGNNTNYSIDVKNIEKEFSLSKNIELEEFYPSQTGELIELAQYSITPPEGTNVIYKTVNLTDFTGNAKYYREESFIAEDDGFNKLKYSNIYDLIYLGTTPYLDNEAARSPIPSNKYTLIKEDGILIWTTDDYYKDGKKIYAYYAIKIPVAIEFSINELYKRIEYNIDAFDKTFSKEITNVKENEIHDLSQYAEYDNADVINVYCNTPGFEAKLKDNKITFAKTAPNNTVAIRSGYYYLDGEEYYMFSNENADTINQSEFVSQYNVDTVAGELLFNKRSRNFVRNSYMTVNNLAPLFYKDFTNTEVSGISRLNSITACESFNNWISFGTNISMAKGYNGLGLKFSPTILNGYAFLDITNYIEKDSYISFYAEDTIEAYIGIENTLSGMVFNKSTTISIDKKITAMTGNNSIFETIISPIESVRQYLVVKGYGIIDDIIIHNISEEDKRRWIHTKNINYLNLSVEETILNDYLCRLYLDNNKGNFSNGAELDSNLKIVNSPLIDWGITKIKDFNSSSSWSKSVLKKVNLSNGIITTLDGQPGSIETEAIYVGDIKTIKNLIYKINDVTFDNMQGFNTKILISDSFNGEYKMTTSRRDNIGYINGNYLMPYIKLLIEMPGGKVINNVAVYIEYMSTEEAAPVEVDMPNGEFITRILDAQYSANYKVKGIQVDSISNINDVQIQIRAAKENYNGDVWSNWHDIKLNDSLQMDGAIEFNDYRFFQVRIFLKNRQAYIKLQYIDLEVI